MSKIVRDGQPFLTTGQVAERLRVPRWAVLVLCERGVLEPVRDERNWRLFLESDVDAVDLSEVQRVIEEAQQEGANRHPASDTSGDSVAHTVSRPDLYVRVDPSDLFTCEYCGRGNLAWVLSRRTGRYYAVQAKWDGDRWIADRRDFHSRLCTGRAGQDVERVEIKRRLFERLSVEDRALLIRIVKQLGGIFARLEERFEESERLRRIEEQLNALPSDGEGGIG